MQFGDLNRKDQKRIIWMILKDISYVLIPSIVIAIFLSFTRFYYINILNLLIWKAIGLMFYTRYKLFIINLKEYDWGEVDGESIDDKWYKREAREEFSFYGTGIWLSDKCYLPGCVAWYKDYNKVGKRDKLIDDILDE